MLLLGARLVLFAKVRALEGRFFRELLAPLSLPLTGMRLVSALMQTVNATLIPARLRFRPFRRGGDGQPGVFHGMLKPILFMPSFVTCSLSMAAAPELTRRQTDGQPLCALSSGMLRAAALGSARRRRSAYG